MTYRTVIRLHLYIEAGEGGYVSSSVSGISYSNKASYRFTDYFNKDVDDSFEDPTSAPTVSLPSPSPQNRRVNRARSTGATNVILEVKLIFPFTTGGNRPAATGVGHNTQW